jgi:adenylate cyclase
LKARAIPILLSMVLLLVFLAHAVGYLRLAVIDEIEYRLYDWRLVATMPKTLDPRVVVLDIDEKSLAEVGRWPWNRQVLAKIMDKLIDQHGMRVVGFDVVFAERDESSGLPQIEALAKGQLHDNPAYQAALPGLRRALDFDGKFGESLKNRPTVMGYFFTADKNALRGGVLPKPVFQRGEIPPGVANFRHFDGYGANLPELQNSAMSGGTFNVTPDADGIVRRMPLVVELGGNYYETLSLAMVRALSGNAPLRLGWAGGDTTGASGIESIEVMVDGKMRSIPIDADVTTLIPYRGRGNVDGGSYRYVSLADVLYDRIEPGSLTGKIGIFGTTAIGLFDLRAAPVGEVYPGVEAHANLISGILDNNIKELPAYTVGAEAFMLLIVGLALGILLPYLSADRSVLFSAIMLFLVIGVNLYFYAVANLVFPLASLLLLIVSVFTLNMVYGYFVESRSKRELAGLFGSYVPPELVDEMAKNPTSYSMEGRSEELTVMFSDVRGFTTISESLKPKELSEYINAYLTSMSLIIQQHRGTLDKYIGDAIMAFWGAPVADPAHAQHAVETAMAMQAEVDKVNEIFRERHWPDMRIGIGVSTGSMSVGDMGSKIRRAYTVMGDAVNLGSRLEGLTKNYGVGILVAESTRHVVQNIVFREVDRVRVKGKDEPVAIFEPIGRIGEVAAAVQQELDSWALTLQAYRTQNWDACEASLHVLQERSPHYLYKEYLARVAALREHAPGPDWDGVTTFTSK